MHINTHHHSPNSITITTWLKSTSIAVTKSEPTKAQLHHNHPPPYFPHWYTQPQPNPPPHPNPNQNPYPPLNPKEDKQTIELCKRPKKEKKVGLELFPYFISYCHLFKWSHYIWLIQVKVLLKLCSIIYLFTDS